MFGKKKNPDPKTGVDYEKLGREVESVLVKDYVDMLRSTKRQIWSAFVRGIFTGLGTVIGATVVVALLVWLLTLLANANIFGLGEFAKSIGNAISHR